jgi:hypothetical protein
MPGKCALGWSIGKLADFTKDGRIGAGDVGVDCIGEGAKVT